jgi:hypothetical protein
MTSPKQRASSPDLIEARSLILKAIAAAETPVSLASLGSLKEFGRRLPGTRVRELLAEDLASGSVFQWGTSKKQMLWHRDPKALASERIMELASIELLTRAELGKRAAGREPKLPAKVGQIVLTSLVREKRLREIAAVPGSKAKSIVNAERPEVYLESAIANLLESFGLTRPRDRIRALFHEVLPLQNEVRPLQVDEGELVRDTAEKIFSAMNRLAFSPGTTVTFYRLRQQPELADIPKAIFDRAALRLQSERRALLSIHDYAAGLPAEEREGFVTDGLGEFYVSIYAR